MTPARDENLLIDHEYDGIQELDNSLPRWWLYGYCFTIAFALLYLLHYHVLGSGPSMEHAYLWEMTAAGYNAPAAVGSVVSEDQERMLGAFFVLSGAFVCIIVWVFRYDADLFKDR